MRAGLAARLSEQRRTCSEADPWVSEGERYGARRDGRQRQGVGSTRREGVCEKAPSSTCCAGRSKSEPSETWCLKSLSTITSQRPLGDVPSQSLTSSLFTVERNRSLIDTHL